MPRKMAFGHRPAAQKTARHLAVPRGKLPCNFLCAVPGQGFEPRFRDPKSLVLPLDDPGVFREHTRYYLNRQWFFIL